MYLKHVQPNYNTPTAMLIGGREIWTVAFPNRLL